MAEFLSAADKRSYYCGEIPESAVGTEVCVMGWVQRQRDLGSLIFIDLRDRTGIVQLAFDENTDRDVFEKAFSCRAEYVVCAHGIVRRRGDGAVNANLATGGIEVYVKSMKILSSVQFFPFEDRINI